MHEQASEQHEATSKTVVSLVELGVITRWARLFASRYKTPARSDEFASHLIGAIAQSPLSSASLTSDDDFGVLFEFARKTIEDHVGRSVLTVAGSIRIVAASQRPQRERAVA